MLTLFLLFISPFLYHLEPIQQPLPEKSTITYHMRHKLHEWDGVSDKLKIQANWESASPVNKITKIAISTKVSSFNSGLSNRDSHMIGLPYPGGPLLDKLAQKGNPKAFVFAKPQVPNLDYSFSGLKTSVLYFLQKQSPEFIQENLNDLCASVQYTIVEILLKQLKKAIQETGIQEFCIAGGVSANSGLRNGVAVLAQKTKSTVFLPAFEYCTDNAAMIAMAAHFKYLEGAFESLAVTASARSNW